MKRAFLFLLLALLAGLLPAAPPGEAEVLLERVRAQHRAHTVASDLRIGIERPDWQRTLKVHMIEDQDRRRYRSEVLSPRKLRGTLFLREGQRLWMYMPKLRRRVTISPAMMLEPWMGSDLTNQDLLQADAIIDDYNHAIVARTTENGMEVVTIESLPKADAPVVWGRLEQRIRSDAVPLEITYYDRHGTAVRRIEFDAVKRFGERKLPTLWRIVPLPESGKRTELRLVSIAFDVPLPEDAFREIPEQEGR
ncbi:MAG: outer membrane lipoprotein-sorting protein [Gammaproteobacteria bacterium]|nr:MAG: outer membrane lipoprotein-sorting protein [Gammaproteobacteria bacterium]